MKICIYGAGAVGGYLAGTMAHAGLDVSVVARGAHLAAIQRDGLTVEMDGHAITSRVQASSDPAELGPQDAVIVSVKVPSLPAVAAGIAPLLRPDTPVMFLSNGIPWWYFQGLGGPDAGKTLPRLDPDDALLHAVGTGRIIGGVFWPACAVPRPGVIRLVSALGRGTDLGTPTGATTAGITRVAEAFRVAGMPAAIRSRIRDVIWEKLAFNYSAGPLAVLTAAPVMATHTEDACIAASRHVVAEALALIAAMGCDVTIDMERVVATNRQLGHRPSILQDLLAGRPMEIDALYSVPLDMARQKGVPMPTLELLVALIKVRAREAGLYAG